MPRDRRKRLKIETTRNAFAYVFAGSGTFRDGSDPRAVLTESAVDPNANPKYDASNHSLVLFDRGDEIAVQAGEEGIRFLLDIGQGAEVDFVDADGLAQAVASRKKELAFSLVAWARPPPTSTTTPTAARAGRRPPPRSARGGRPGTATARPGDHR